MSTYTQLLFQIWFNTNNSTNLPLLGPSRAFEQLVINLEKIICTNSWIIVLPSRGSESPNEFSQYDNNLTLFNLSCRISYNRTHYLFKLNWCFKCKKNLSFFVFVGLTYCFGCTKPVIWVYTCSNLFNRSLIITEFCCISTKFASFIFIFAFCI